VGEHLVQVFSSKFHVIGFDVSESRVQALAEKYVDNDKVTFSSCPARISTGTHFLISVPTLLRPNKTIDSTYISKALSTVAGCASPGSTVVIESSVAVGMTRQLLGPLASQHNFFAGMSPEECKIAPFLLLSRPLEKDGNSNRALEMIAR
jgi:UDP-N-acetyl-D-mannosaminuronate dehydrogenase